MILSPNIRHSIYFTIFYIVAILSAVSDSVNRGISIVKKIRTSLYNWIIYKQGSKAKERKGEEEQCQSK